MRKLALALVKINENTWKQARIWQTTELQAGAQGLQAPNKDNYATGLILPVSAT